MKVVIDTNVIVSALLIPASIPGIILKETLSGKLTIVYDSRIYSEYINVFYRDKFKINKGYVKYIIEYIQKTGEFIIPDVIKTPFNDETDKKFYEVYKTGMAQYLITGNIKHYPKDTGIITPRDFIEKTHIFFGNN